MDLFNHQRLLDQDRVDELDKLVFKSISFLPKLALEYSCVVNIKRLFVLNYLIFHLYISFLFFALVLSVFAFLFCLTET